MSLNQYRCYRCYRCYRSIHWSDMFSSNLSTDLFQSQLRSFFRPYWGDFGDILEKTWFLGHRVWFECFFLEAANSSFFPFEPKKRRMLVRVLPAVFSGTLKIHLPKKKWKRSPIKTLRLKVEMVKSYKEMPNKMMEMMENGGKVCFFNRKIDWTKEFFIKILIFFKCIFFKTSG